MENGKVFKIFSFCRIFVQNYQKGGRFFGSRAFRAKSSKSTRKIYVALQKGVGCISGIFWYNIDGISCVRARDPMRRRDFAPSGKEQPEL